MEYIIPDKLYSVPRVCGDDPAHDGLSSMLASVFPAYAGMILRQSKRRHTPAACSPRMRG